MLCLSMIKNLYRKKAIARRNAFLAPSVDEVFGLQRYRARAVGKRWHVSGGHGGVHWWQFQGTRTSSMGTLTTSSGFYPGRRYKYPPEDPRS